MVEEHEEIETKYELTPQTALPPLSALLRELPGAVEAGLRAGDHRELALEAVYFDTADLRLSAAKATLRRRTGGEDAGWHLKTPGSNGARLERQVPLGRAVRTVPVALRRLIEDLTAGEQLVPVAQVNTRRLVQTVLDAQSRQVLEFADDSVEARRLLPSGVAGEARDARQVWREAELELVDGDRAVFDLVDAALRSAGLTVSTSSSKLARVLGAEPAPSPAPSPEPSPVAEPAPPRAAVAPRTLSPRASATRKGLSVKSSAGDVLLVHLREQVGQIFDQDARVRADEAESVHRMRVATRRLRSALQTFQPLLASSSKPLRDELRWLAAELGKARDAEVLRDRLVQAVTSLDSPVEDQPRSPVEDQLTVQVAEQLGSAYRRAHDEVLAGLDSERYQRFLDALQEFVEQPRMSPRSRRTAGRVLPGRVAHTYATLADLVSAAEELPAGRERDELLHEARKAAKQVRYAAEAVAGVFGKDAKRFAAAVTQVQEVLGEHQDSVVTRERLATLAAQAQPEVAFAYGRLYAAEETHGVSSESDFTEVWAALRAKRLHRWLR